MDGPATPADPSKFKSRHRYPRRIFSHHQRHPAPALDHAHDAPGNARRHAAPPARENMSKGHRFFHRRPVPGNTKVITVAVEVVDQVDSNGSLAAQETLAPVTLQASHDAVITPPAAPTVPAALPTVSALPTVLAVPSVPAVPAVPAMPAVPSVAPALPAVPPVPVVSAVPVPALPSVPPVPPFPDNLHVPSVPAYPFSTGNALAQVAAPSPPFPVSSSLPTRPPSPVTPPAVPTPAPVYASSSAANTTTPGKRLTCTRVLAPLTWHSRGITTGIFFTRFA